jgi:hypothetical protein
LSSIVIYNHLLFNIYITHTRNSFLT